MTILQLKVAIAAAEQKSISAAAKALEISQPNASNCLKLLEEELGFPILSRSRAGTELTSKGQLFLDHAKTIVSESEQILALRTADSVYRLHLGITGYVTALEPYYNLYAKRVEMGNTDFSYRTVKLSDGIPALFQRNLDLLVTPVMTHMYSSLQSACKKNHLELIPICQLPVAIILRNSHPAVSDGSCQRIEKGSALLKAYPYVAVRSDVADANLFGFPDSDYIKNSHTVYVESKNALCRMLASTNGFSFDIMPADRIMAQHSLLAFPVPDVSVEIYAIARIGDHEQTAIKEYLELLSAELERLR